MNKKLSSVLFLMFALIFGLSQNANASSSSTDGEIDTKQIIFSHLGDGYGWEVPFNHHKRIPLPVIVCAKDGTWHCFSSANLTKHVHIHNPETGIEEEIVVPNLYTADNGTQFILAQSGSNKDKVVEIKSLTKEEETTIKLQAEEEAKKDGIALSDVVIDGYLNDNGVFYKEYKPIDISITKNVMALFICMIVVFLCVMSVARWHKRNPLKAPRKGTAFLEMLVEFIYDGVIKSTLGQKAPKFAPYLLTAFFFILIMNLLGLIVIFPGGANLTGNIAVTMTLAILTFIVTNVLGTKHYWKEIFWPDVPMFLKFPLPIMQMIEIFGIFTKPAALCVRLFANMMGGHMIVITLTVIIFIFAAFGTAAASGSTVVSLLFSIFMLVLDVLVSFIQAYVFTMLSTMFISMAQESGHHEEHQSEKLATENK